MRNTLMLTLAAALAAIVSTTPVHAQNDVTFVDIGGSDATCNNAGGGRRCRTLQRAADVTNPGGVVYCLTGTDHSGLIIGQSVTIDCSNTNTSIVAAAPVIINAAATVVTLRGLQIHGGTNVGIQATHAVTLIIDDLKIEHTSGSGILFAPDGPARLAVSNSFISGIGSNVSTAGIHIRPTAGGSANVSVSRTDMKDNTNGIFVDGSGGGGAVNLSVRDSLVTGSSNSGIVVAAGGSSITALIDRTTVNYSVNTGVAAAGAAATVRIGNSTISNNVTGVAVFSGASLRSFKNNQIKANGTDGTPIAADNLD